MILKPFHMGPTATAAASSPSLYPNGHTPTLRAAILGNERVLSILVAGNAENDFHRIKWLSHITRMSYPPLRIPRTHSMSNATQLIAEAVRGTEPRNRGQRLLS